MMRSPGYFEWAAMTFSARSAPTFSGSTFFFSSRSRHTRWTGDWSSDVCSSDLSVDDPDTKLGHDCYIVRDVNGHPLARRARPRNRRGRAAAHLMTRDEARKLPELLR